MPPPPDLEITVISSAGTLQLNYCIIVYSSHVFNRLLSRQGLPSTRYWDLLEKSNSKSFLHKENRCLARYSPRATTTNRPTNRAPNKPAWPGPNLVFLSIAGSFGALLVGWLVVVARGLYLARHLFTLCVFSPVIGVLLGLYK